MSEKAYVLARKHQATHPLRVIVLGCLAWLMWDRLGGGMLSLGILITVFSLATLASILTLAKQVERTPIWMPDPATIDPRTAAILEKVSKN